jgi:3',5'-cyclic AMP phosphodiesterase CpdA
MSVLLQLSDPHFGTEKPEVVEALVALTRELAPELVVLSGDITQRARSEQFARAAAFVERLAAPRVLAIPGNHDIPLFDVATRLLDPYRRYRRAFGAELEPRHSAPEWLVLAVKTTRRYRHVDGEISDAQRARVAGELRRATPGQVRVVVTHQPVAVPRASEEHNVAHGSTQAVQAWSEAGADVILAGHIHLPFVLPLHETMGPLPRALWAVNAGTALSWRTRREAGNSVNVLRVTATPQGEPGLRVEHWGFSAAKGGFVRTADHSLPTGPVSRGEAQTPGILS